MVIQVVLFAVLWGSLLSQPFVNRLSPNTRAINHSFWGRHPLFKTSSSQAMGVPSVKHDLPRPLFSFRCLSGDMHCFFRIHLVQKTFSQDLSRLCVFLIIQQTLESPPQWARQKLQYDVIHLWHHSGFWSFVSNIDAFYSMNHKTWYSKGPTRSLLSDRCPRNSTLTRHNLNYLYTFS